MRSALFFILLLPSLAIQAQSVDTTKVYRPQAFRFGYTVSSALRTLIDGSITQFAGHADIPFYRFMLAADVGYQQAERTPREADGVQYNYSNEGVYYKIGIDYNLVNNERENPIADRNVFYVGLHFAQALFSDESSFMVDDLLRGPVQQQVKNERANAWWVEGVVGTKAEITGNLYLGFNTQIRFSPSVTTSGTLDPFDIPGYGSGARILRVGFEFYLLYRLRL